MALTRVQATARGNHGFSQTFTFPAFATPPTVGNGLVLLAGTWSSITIGTITDNWGNTYTLAGETVNGANSGACIWYCPKIVASGSPFTITASYAGANFNYATSCAIEVTGVGTGLLVDRAVGTTGGVGTGLTCSTGSTAALTGPDNFVAAVHANRGVGAITVQTVSPAWTQEFEDTTTATCPGEGDTRVLTSTAGTTTSCSWTIASENTWSAQLVAFRAPAAATAARVSQDAIEILSLPFPAARVTQDVIEILGTATATIVDARVTQALVELLTANPPVPTPVQVTQALVELLGQSAPLPVRVTQVFAEIFAQHPAGARATQLALEVFKQQAVAARTTQVAVEIFLPRSIPVRQTQTAVEYFQGRTARAHVSQAIVEVFRTVVDNCPLDFPIDTDLFP